VRLARSGQIALALVFLLPAIGQAQLMLAGGSLPVCSSMSPEQCADLPEWPTDALRAHAFRVNADNLERWQNSLDTGAQTASGWIDLLQQIGETEALSRRELTRRIQAARGANLSGQQLLDQSDARAWSQLLDHLQEPVVDQREHVRLDDSKRRESVEIFRAFVAMAAERNGRERPLIAVSTASSRDPYDALEFYLQVFAQAGADVVWLPLDGAVRAARDAGQCNQLGKHQAAVLGSWERARVYPDLYAEQTNFCRQPEAGSALMRQIDGLFLNGGDQSLTLQAFLTPDGHSTPEHELLIQRLHAGDLVLGGTSAGAAVQSGPVMISNGSSTRALLDGAVERSPPPASCDRAGNCPAGLGGDSLTFRRGGLGSFEAGIVDTHFSERWRQFRLLQLLTQTGTGLGLGVDETTAVIAEQVFSSEQRPKLTTVGAGSAWLIDLGQIVVHDVIPLRLDQAMLHRMPNGARLIVNGTDKDSAQRNTSYHDASSSCETAGQYASFSALMDALPDQPTEPVCFDFELNDGYSARSMLVTNDPPAGSSGVQSWTWSLQVQTLF